MIPKNGSNCIEKIKRSFGILTPFLKLFSLNCDIFLIKKPTVVCIVRFILPAIILGLIDALTLYFKIMYTYKYVVVSIKYTDAVQVIFDLCQYTFDLYVVYNCGSSLKEYYKIYEKLDAVLGLKYYRALTGSLRNIVIFYALVWTISCTCDFWAWLDATGWQTAASFSVSYVFVLIKIITSLDMTIHLMHMEYRLRAIADSAESICKKLDQKQEFINGKSSVRVITVSATNNINDLKCLGKCYVWALELVGFINHVFGTRVLLNTLSILIDIVRFTNIAARILFGSQHLHQNATGIFPVVSTLMRLFTCVAMVVSLARRCELVYAQRDRLLSILDHALIFKEPSEDIKEEMNELRILIQFRPVEFSMTKLARIDYPLLGSMASIVVTYTIILLQSVN